MKEYKIIPVQLAYQAEANQSKPTTISNCFIEFFFPPEELTNSHLATENAEKVMQKMNCEGWEVASTAVMGENVLLITFEREL
jgi:hypothetical protein